MNLLVLGFLAFHGVFRVTHPIRKMVRLDETNHIVCGSEVIFTRHPPNRSRFHIHPLPNSNSTLLVNVQNATDYMIIQPHNQNE